MDFPYRGVADIRPEDEENSIIEFNGKITVGSIRPKKRVTIFLWAKDSPRSYKEDDIGLTHTNGIGSITFARKTFGFWNAVFEHLPGWLIAGFLGLGVSFLWVQFISKIDELRGLRTEVDELKSGKNDTEDADSSS